MKKPNIFSLGVGGFGSRNYLLKCLAQFRNIGAVRLSDPDSAQTKGKMRLSLGEVEDLCNRVVPDSHGKYRADDFIKILCNN